MSLRIPAELTPYVRLTENGDMIDRFKCPVCTFTTRLGPGALRMHILIKADPMVKGRYDQIHEDYVRQHPEFNLDMVRKLATFPRTEI